MDIAAGEYIYQPHEALAFLEAHAIDVLQADATRCLGITGFLQVAHLAEAFHVPLSTHTAPMLHLPLACAVQQVRHLEYFHDHVRIERQFFDGFIEAKDGLLAPDRTRPGLGFVFKHQDAEPFKVFSAHIDSRGVRR